MTEVRYTYSPEETDARVITENTLGMFDAKGREIGYTVETYYVEWTAHECRYGAFTQEQAQAEATERNNRRFAVRIQATRDNRRYGAYQAPRYFACPALRDAAIIAYVADAKKRAAKKAK